MLLTPIVIACSVGFLAVVYNYVERNKKAGGVKLVVVNNKQHEVGGKVDTTEDRVAWAIDLCRSEGFYDDKIIICTELLVSAMVDAVNNKQSTVTIDLEKLMTEYRERESSAQRVDQPADAPPVTASEPDPVDSSVNEMETEEDPTQHTQELAPVLRKLPLEINGITYVFEYVVSDVPEERRSIASKLAVTFCTTHGEKLVEEHSLFAEVREEGESMEDFQERRHRAIQTLVQSQCQEPVQGALEANMEYPPVTVEEK